MCTSSLFPQIALCGRLLKLPKCLLVTMLAVPVDVVIITAVALWKSPYMLFRGWKRLLEDLIGREGPFLETVCVPFAGLAIILWPLAVVGAVIGAFFSSFFLGLYSGVIVHQVYQNFFRTLINYEFHLAPQALSEFLLWFEYLAYI